MTTLSEFCLYKVEFPLCKLFSEASLRMPTGLSYQIFLCEFTQLATSLRMQSAEPFLRLGTLNTSLRDFTSPRFLREFRIEVLKKTSHSFLNDKSKRILSI